MWREALAMISFLLYAFGDEGSLLIEMQDFNFESISKGDSVSTLRMRLYCPFWCKMQRLYWLKATGRHF